MTTLKYHITWWSHLVVLIGIQNSKNNHRCIYDNPNHILSMKMPYDHRTIHCLHLIDICYFKPTQDLSMLNKFLIPPIRLVNFGFLLY